MELTSPLLVESIGRLTTVDAMKAIAAVFALYTSYLAIYRLFVSPLAKIPGPKLAALTYWYEFYYECYLPGRYMFKIKELHAKYGPIVRINPGEVHIFDINYYDTIYSAGGNHPRNKIRHLALHDDSMFDTFDSALHRKRRAAVASAFSKQSIRALEPAICRIVEDYAKHLEKHAATGQIFEFHALWNSLTQETIGQYCFCTEDIKSLRDERDDAQYLGTFHDSPVVNPWGRMFPWAFDLLGSLPYGVLALIDPAIGKVGKFNQQIMCQIRKVLVMDSPLVGAKNVFHEMRDSKHLPEKDKRLEYYQCEAVSFIGGGTETTASSLTTLTYWLLARPDKLNRLRQELNIVMSENDGKMPSVATLEALPYLTGVVREGIRLSFGVPGRLPRVAPNENLEYAGFKLPQGTVLSSSSYHYHTDEKLYPQPFLFEPERWLDDPKGLQQNFLPFSRGARMCIGINLAYSEIYLAVAYIFSRFDFELVDTTERDVEIVHDNFIGRRPRDSKGVRARVVGKVVKGPIDATKGN